MASPREAWRRILVHPWTPLVLIPLLVAAIYGRTLGFGFIGWDDSTLIEADFGFLSDWSNLPKAFQRDVFDAEGRTAGDNYYRPLMTLSLMLDAHLGGKDPRVYHLTNLVLHAAACSVLYVFLLGMDLPRRAAAFLSLIYAAHPVLVQAAAFITARNTSLLTIFALAAMIFFIRFHVNGSPAACALHLLFFACALFTKESGIGLVPAAALMWVYLFGAKASDRRLVALSGGWLAIIAVWLALRGNALEEPPSITPGAVFAALRENLPVPFQLAGKLIFPFNLSVLPNIQDTGLGLAATAFLLATGLLAASRTVRWKRVAFGVAWFLIFIGPSLLIPILTGLEFRVYLPGVGLLLLLSEVDALKEPGIGRPRFLAGACALLALFAFLSFQQSAIFRDGYSFWSSVVDSSPHSEIGYNKLGTYFRENSKPEAAEEVFRKGLSLIPLASDLRNNLGILYAEQGKFSQAEAEFMELIRTNPRYAEAYFNLGVAYFLQQRRAQARAAWQHTLKLSPGHSKARDYLSRFPAR